MGGHHSLHVLPDELIVGISAHPDMVLLDVRLSLLVVFLEAKGIDKGMLVLNTMSVWATS